jgi:hypothetical protein
VQSVDFPCLSHVHPPRTVSQTAWKTVPAVTEKLNQLCRMYLSAPDILAQLRSADCVYATAAELTAYCVARMDATGVSAYIRREERIFRDDVAKAPRPEGAVPTGEHRARLAQQSAARQAKHASITALLVVLTLQHTADTHTSPDAQRRSAMEDEANAPSSSTPEPATQACSDADSCGDTISENGTADDDSTTSTGTSSVTSTSDTPLDSTESSVSSDGDTGPTTSDSSTRSPTPLMAIQRLARCTLCNMDVTEDLHHVFWVRNDVRESTLELAKWAEWAIGADLGRWECLRRRGRAGLCAFGTCTTACAPTTACGAVRGGEVPRCLRGIVVGEEGQ